MLTHLLCTDAPCTIIPIIPVILIKTQALGYHGLATSFDVQHREQLSIARTTQETTLPPTTA